ncbi:MAG: M15 family metallopeptidase [Patescibacteria group bacterium]
MSRPIPDLSRLRSEKSAYRNYPICPISEKCLKVNSGMLCRSYYWDYKPRPAGAIEEIFLRKSFIAKLKAIDEELNSLGLRLLIQEGYRPLLVQRFVQEVSVLKGLRKENPNLGEAELFEKLKMFAASADMDLQLSPPPHLTGGVADVNLVYLETGKVVDMGKRGGLYNTAFPDALENYNFKTMEQPKRFRRLLFWLAFEQGITTNPTEWWHISWGDQMWAWITKSSCAMYGAADDLLS